MRKIAESAEHKEGSLKDCMTFKSAGNNWQYSLDFYTKSGGAWLLKNVEAAVRMLMKEQSHAVKVPMQQGWGISMSYIAFSQADRILQLS